MPKVKINKKDLLKLLNLVQAKANANDASLGSGSIAGKMVLSIKEDKVVVDTLSKNGNVITHAECSGVSVGEVGDVTIPIGETIECLKTLKGDDITIDYDRSLCLTDGNNGWEYTVEDPKNIIDPKIHLSPWDYSGDIIKTIPSIPKDKARAADLILKVQSSDILNAINAGKIAGKRNKTLLVELVCELEKNNILIKTGIVGEKTSYNNIPAIVESNPENVKNFSSKFSYGMGNVFSNTVGEVSLCFVRVRDRNGRLGYNFFAKNQIGNVSVVYYIVRVIQKATTTKKVK